jgi:hypothetical protein
MHTATLLAPRSDEHCFVRSRKTRADAVTDDDRRQSSSVNVQIVVALIGLVGVLGAALLANWDKVFSKSQEGTLSGGNPSGETTLTGAASVTLPHQALKLEGTAASIPRSPGSATSEPSVDEVYETAKSGDLENARRMIGEVLQAHPQSPKAHYVAAWVYAEGGELSEGKSELALAEKLDPSVQFASASALEDLRRILSNAVN